MNLIEGILQECNRVRQILPAYDELGPVGLFGANALRCAIADGEAAMGSGDIVRMVRAYLALKDCE